MPSHDPGERVVAVMESVAVVMLSNSAREFFAGSDGHGSIVMKPTHRLRDPPSFIDSWFISP
jgi:hypothetical protein